MAEAAPIENLNATNTTAPAAGKKYTLNCFDRYIPNKIENTLVFIPKH